MTILVTYASRHGSTGEIASRIAARLNAAGMTVEVQPMKHITTLSHYDVFVIGSALYFGSWMKEAVAFARQHQSEISARPVWLFSSGPLGTETVDTEGHDIRESTVPKELAELTEVLKPREHVVFPGALDSHNFGVTERMIRALPGGKKLLVEGDFRDWEEIDAWAEQIAAKIAGPVTVQS